MRVGAIRFDCSVPGKPAIVLSLMHLGQGSAADNLSLICEGPDLIGEARAAFQVLVEFAALDPPVTLSTKTRDAAIWVLCDRRFDPTFVPMNYGNSSIVRLVRKEGKTTEVGSEPKAVNAPVTFSR
jgi:hypothetical protein